jgi:ribosylpyrimidine nucleosidase
MANAVENLAPSPQDVFGFDSPPLHDPTAVAYVIDPSLFQVGPDVACCGYA